MNQSPVVGVNHMRRWREVSTISAKTGWCLKKNENSLVYLNNNIITSEQLYLKNGDVVNIYGLKLLFVFDVVFINDPLNNIKINNNLFLNVQLNINDSISDEEIIDQPLYKDEEYYLKSPRLKRGISTFDMKIDSPPAKENEKNVPLFYTLGPMLTMGASSMVTLTDTMSKVGSGEKTWGQAAPSLVISGAMICSMLVWPFLTRIYQKNQKNS